MRPASCFAAGALFSAASPALATGTIVCTAAQWPGLDLALVVSEGVGGVTQATISNGGEEITTGVGQEAPVIAQAWIDERELKVDIVDANVEARIARLNTRRHGGAYSGTLIYRGRTVQVRCEEAG